MVSRSSSLLILVLALSAMAGAAMAGSLERHGDRSHQRESADLRKHHHHGHRDRGVTSPNGLPSVVPGIGTYSGAISAVRIKGVGNYFMVSGNLGAVGGPVLAPKARIIEVGSNDACSYEAGVCVIRP